MGFALASRAGDDVTIIGRTLPGFGARTMIGGSPLLTTIAADITSEGEVQALFADDACSWLAIVPHADD